MRNARLGLVALAMASAALPVGPVNAAPPHRIVSLNLCADQLVLALADRSQIAGLTRNADKADISAEATRARGLRLLSTSAEEILELRPDLILGTPSQRNPAIGALGRQQYRMVDVPSADTLQDIYTSMRQVGKAVGHLDRAEKQISLMRQALAGIAPVGRGKVAAYYQRRGYLTGTGTLIDDLMRRVGLVNLAGRLGKSVLSQLSLEELVAARPDYIIVESATDRVTDLGTEMLHHPALRGIPRISIPQAWTVCGGPAYVKAARSMTEQISRPSRAP